MAAGHEPDDAVGRRGAAAAGELGHQEVDADHQDATAGAGVAAGAALAPQRRAVALQRRGVGERGACAVRRPSGGLGAGADRLLEHPRADLVAADREEQLVGARKPEAAGELLVGERRAALALQHLLDLVTAGGHVVLELERVEPLADLGARPRAAHVAELHVQPVARRTVRAAARPSRDDLDRLAVAQHRVERNHLPVDPRTPTAVPEQRVHVIGEVDRRRARRQLDHPRLGRQQVDAVGGVARAGGDAPAQRRTDLLLPHQKLAHPFDTLVLGERRLAAVGGSALGATHGAGRGAAGQSDRGLLVAPVRGDAELGVPVHLAGPDLDLERPVVLGGDHRVQRLVAVGLGPRNVVVELARDRRPDLVDDAEHRVALLHVVDQHAEGPQVLDLGEGQPLGPHLVVDAVDVLGPASDLGGDTLGAQRLAQALDGGAHEILALDAPLLELTRDALVELGLEEAERQVLELPLELAQAQPVGQRRQHLERLVGDAGLGCTPALGMPAQRLQPRGEPQQHDPDVARHRQRHPAQRLELHTRARGVRAQGQVLQAQQLAHAVDQRAHLVAPAGDDLVERHRVADAEQHGRHPGGLVDIEGLEDLERAPRMRDDGLAAAAHRPAQPRPGELERLGHGAAARERGGSGGCRFSSVGGGVRGSHGGDSGPLGAGAGSRAL